MINGFEEYTKELNDKEKNEILPILIKVLKARVGKNIAITNKEIVKKLKEVSGIKTTEPRIRKIINAIRMTGAVERLIATSRGYYVSNDPNEIETYIESLIQRAESIQAIANQLNFQLKNPQKS